MRYILGCLLIFLCAVGLKKAIFSSQKESPFFLQNSTFIEGVGLKSLGKHFLLQHKGDRELFVCAKSRLFQAKKKWQEGTCISIPYVIHYIWLNKGALSEDLLRAQASLKEAHPDCRLTVWDKKSIQKLMSSQEQSIFSMLPLVIQKELARALVLYHSGGVVLDYEIQCLSSFKEIFSSGQWIVTFEPPLQRSLYGRKLWLSTAFMAASPRNPSVHGWLSSMFSYFKTQEWCKGDDKKLLMEGVLLPLIKQFQSVEESQGVYALPATCFIPIAPQFMNGYLKKLSGETVESKGTACMGLVRAPFSKVTRATFGLHMRGGRLGEIGAHKK